MGAVAAGAFTKRVVGENTLYLRYDGEYFAAG